MTLKKREGRTKLEYSLMTRERKGEKRIERNDADEREGMRKGEMWCNEDKEGEKKTRREKKIRNGMTKVVMETDTSTRKAGGGGGEGGRRRRTIMGTLKARR